MASALRPGNWMYCWRRRTLAALLDDSGWLRSGILTGPVTGAQGGQGLRVQHHDAVDLIASRLRVQLGDHLGHGGEVR